MGRQSAELVGLDIAVMTVSDKHDAESDTSGNYLCQAVIQAGHRVADYTVISNNCYQIRAVVSRWIASDQIQAAVINGGTGFNSKNSTPEALLPLFDREVEGFGELFRMLSWKEIGSATLQSRALAGMANQTLIFAIPGAVSACQLAWEQIIVRQLDVRTTPCNFFPHLKKSELCHD